MTAGELLPHPALLRCGSQKSTQFRMRKVQLSTHVIVGVAANLKGIALLLQLSLFLIFGVKPFPQFGVSGDAGALNLYHAEGTFMLGWYHASGHNHACAWRGRLPWEPIRHPHDRDAGDRTPIFKGPASIAGGTYFCSSQDVT